MIATEINEFCRGCNCNKTNILRINKKCRIENTITHHELSLSYIKTRDDHRKPRERVR